ncbi:TatD family hydrolase [Pseudoclavibacter helvolus]|uniref:TatD family hydrolase n=1 Tax=Pseudoclavibacter helvolus TaxID=255205 RepID=UPI003C77C10A
MSDADQHSEAPVDGEKLRRRSATSESGHTRILAYPPYPESLAVPCYDNHTHLEIEDGEEDERLSLDEHLDAAVAAGVQGVVQVGNDVPSSQWSARVAATHERVLAAVALHPNVVPELAAAGQLESAIAEIDRLAAEPRVRAIGETGLDYFRTPEKADQLLQVGAFERHIELAKRHGIAMQIHDRDAHDDVIATLKRVGAPERTVFHCFSGDADMARIAAAEGWYLSFAGTVTFKNAASLREALAVTPLERILVETDAPFLTPVPFRGRPNAPYLIPVTLRAMAAHLDLPVDELSAQVGANTEAVYGSWNLAPASAAGPSVAAPSNAGQGASA